MKKHVHKRKKDPGNKCNLLTKKAKKREKKARKKAIKKRAMERADNCINLDGSEEDTEDYTGHPKKSFEKELRKEITVDNCTPEEWNAAMDEGVEFIESSMFDIDEYQGHPDDESEDESSSEEEDKVPILSEDHYDSDEDQVEPGYCEGEVNDLEEKEKFQDDSFNKQKQD